MKDDIIARLNEELIKKENQLKSEVNITSLWLILYLRFVSLQVEKIKDKYEGELAELRRDTSMTIDYLKNQLTSTANELVLLDSYKRDKENHDRKLAALEATVKEHEVQLFDALEAQERCVVCMCVWRLIPLKARQNSRINTLHFDFTS